jgi:hypothetical protein
MESKKINQLATNVAPQTSDLTIIGDPVTGVSKKITLLQIANLFATTGTVTSVAVSRDGDALTITGSPITTAGTINIGFSGSNAQYINGEGDLVTFPSLADFVTLSTAQTITAEKTFANDITFNGYALMDIGVALAKTSGTPLYASTIGYANLQLVNSGSVNSLYLNDGDTLKYSKLSFNNAADYTYTFPTATGTIALTSDIPSLTGYVPYTGATANLNLGTFDLTADVITGATGSFASSGGSDTFAINHSSGSGIALNITKGGNGEGLVINKTSGSGNALSVTGSTSLGALSGTSASFSSDILVSGVRVGIGSGGTNNTRVGPLSFMSNTTGSFNTAIGTYTLNANTTGSGNTALGNIALIVNTTGQNNTAIGAGTLGNITTGSNNTGLGIEAGISITTGSNNTIIGNYAGTAALANNIVLADGQGNVRYQWDGTNNVFGNPISGTSATFSSSVTASQGIFFNPANSASTTYIGHSNVGAYLGTAVSAPLYFETAGTERMRITSAGNVGIGTSSPAVRFQVKTATNINLGIQTGTADTTGVKLNAFNDAADTNIPMELNGSIMILKTGETERMRITSGGFFKASNYGGYFGSTLSYHEFGTNSNGNWNTIMYHTAASPYGIYIPYTSASPNSAGNEYLFFTDTSATRFSVRSNGGIANFQANDVNLSDERTKKDIIPLDSYWDKFKAIEIVKFKYKDQTHDDFNIGVIAQQVKKIAPEFVDVDGWDTKPKLDEDGNEIISEEEPLMSVYTADLHHATIKVLQEAMARIEEQQAQIEELKQLILNK